MYNNEKIVINSFQILIEKSNRNVKNTALKLNRMQNLYLKTNREIYSEIEIKSIDYYFRALIFKFLMANISLEQLWSLSILKRSELIFALENSIKKLDITDEELIMISFVFENFLFQSRTFLEFIMLYLCKILKTNQRGSISTKKFYNALDKINECAFKEKSLKIKEYFKTNIFGVPDWDFQSPKDWGTLLTSLRDKIAHRDTIKYSFKSDEILQKTILFNWPTLKDITYDRFCQYIQNGMFILFADIAPIIYELEWISGSFNENMWE